MTENVLVRVCGLQKVGEEEEEIEVMTGGIYRKSGNFHYVKYDECYDQDGYLQEVTKNLIKISKDYSRIEVTKTGLTKVQMVFQKGEENQSFYETPFGLLAMGIRTDHIEVDEQEDQMNIKILYGLDINYEFVADCEITIRVTSKGTKKRGD